MRDWAHSRRLGTSADEASYVVLRQPPASKLANLFRIDVRYHALGLVVTQQLGGRVTVPAVLLALCRLVVVFQPQLVEKGTDHASLERNLCEGNESARARTGRGGRRHQALRDLTRGSGRGVHRLPGHHVPPAEPDR